jgi:hypothetical protein
MESGIVIFVILGLVTIIVFTLPVKVVSVDNDWITLGNGEKCLVIEGTEHKCCRDTALPGIRYCHTCFEDYHSGEFNCEDDWTIDYGVATIIEEPSNKGQNNTNIGNNGGILIDRDTQGKNGSPVDKKADSVINTTNDGINPKIGTFGKNNNPFLDKNEGGGVAENIQGDPSSWCEKQPSGKEYTCRCKTGSTDCLHMCQYVDCPLGCLGNPAGCEVDVPTGDIEGRSETPEENKTQGTFSPDFNNGADNELSEDPDSTVSK